MEAAHCLAHANGATDTEPSHCVCVNFHLSCLSAMVNPHPITPSHAYKCLARAVKVAEGHYKSQKPPQSPSSYRPPTSSSSSVLFDLQPVILPLFSLKCQAREILGGMKEKTRGTVKKSPFFFVRKTGTLLSVGTEKNRRKTKRRCGWKTRKRFRGGTKEEREDLSCMIGVSGRFLCDIQVEART